MASNGFLGDDDLGISLDDAKGDQRSATMECVGWTSDFCAAKNGIDLDVHYAVNDDARRCTIDGASSPAKMKRMPQSVTWRNQREGSIMRNEVARGLWSKSILIKSCPKSDFEPRLILT